ncbi:hypothetical protein ACFYKX_11500 [Cytobacillus sp. FJAT-54145]|uniref:Uncharacterized protein n=1 Tax=Cytobacillus spartinae TaxID=3299023 RepID=A0ABW6KAJ2_9BACI
MQRELFCCGCGLFHWIEEYRTGENGMLQRVPYSGCPNESCDTHKTDEIPIFHVDSMGFLYFAERHNAFIDEVKWSSPKYAPAFAIDVYRRQGIPIRDKKSSNKRDQTHVAMRTSTGEVIQLAENLSFKEAYSLVIDMRSKQDGNFYWIAKVTDRIK